MYDQRRTDTTYLPFTDLRYEDEGKYKLQMIYINCQGELDTTFTDEVQLFLFGNTEIIYQTTTVYGIENGYAKMQVSVVTPGATENVPVTYQWYRKKKNQNPIILNDDGHYIGTKSSILMIVDIDYDHFSELDATGEVFDYYYCVVTGLCDAIGTDTDPIQLKEAPAIKIVTQPSNKIVCLDEDANISVIVNLTDPSEPVIYKWYKIQNGDSLLVSNGGNISGANTNNLNITGITTSDAGAYYLVIEYVNLLAGIASNTCTLIVETPPVVVPMKQTIANGSDTLNVAEDGNLALFVTLQPQPGTFYQYQWYLDGTNLFGAASSNYTVSSISTYEEGMYSVSISSLNGCGESWDSIYVKVGNGILEENDPNFRILNIMPNPVSYEATINYILPAAQEVSLTLMDASGGLVAELFYGMGIAGENMLHINNKFNQLSSGTYFVILASKNKTTSYKIDVAK
jgi:hypothetical protein